MEKLLSEYRRPLGDFDLIDFEDEAVIEGVRSRVDVDVPVDLHWTWSYGSEVEELRRLSSNDEINIAEEVGKLQEKVQKLMAQTYDRLTPWQKVKVARHSGRPP